jgi:nitrogen fixation NifU-like protein
MYNVKILDHYDHPRNIGNVENPDATGLVGAPTCGDVMKLTLRIEDGVITDAKVKVFGCGAAIASSSYLTELITGRTVEEAAAIKNSMIAKALDLPPVKIHCSVLAEDALKMALTDYRKRRAAREAAALPGR